jgi:ADP-ribosyl-[dinitrogen reductase] hydrolase
MQPSREFWQARFAGLLLGCAVGDALGLPAEGLSPRRIKRRWGSEWTHHFFLGRGMTSDDTEHTFLVAQALLTHSREPVAFQQSFGWKLRLWLLGLPAGVGWATFRAILRLWVGFPPHRSGLLSAGNGPAMRSPILGAYFADAPDSRRAYVGAATRLTHTDPRAAIAAQAMAETAAWAVNQDRPADQHLRDLHKLGDDPEWRIVCNKLAAAFAAQASVQAFADSLGLHEGVTGYAYHSAPVGLFAFFRHPGDFRSAMEAALSCGGDTDTVGAMVGALCGAQVGVEGIPARWRDGVFEWPRSTRLLERVASRLAEQKVTGRPQGAIWYAWPGLVPRNLFFLLLVLLHGLRRLAPPY